MAPSRAVPGETDEIALTGGRVTAGIVRVGDTVRRPPTANSAFVRDLLIHLARRGFDAAPTSLGTDDRGRDILSYVEGDVPADLAWHDDATLRRAAGLIRRFHDLGAELVSPGPGLEVVCHNDLSPCNFVFRAGVPVAILDFDAAGPGTRARDLGYAAWLWLDLGSPDIGPAEQHRRLSAFLAFYGTPDRAAIVAAIAQRQSELAAEGERSGRATMAEWAAECLAWTRRHAGLLRGE